MKVIIASRAVIPFHEYGGMEKYVYFLGKYLVENGIDVEVVTSIPTVKKRQEVLNGVKYTFIPPILNRWKENPAMLWSFLHLFSANVAKYLKKIDVDILHSYEISAYRYLHLDNRVPVVFQPFVSYQTPQFLNITSNRLVETLKQPVKYLIKIRPLAYCARNADAIASEGDFQIREIMDIFGIEREKIFSLPVGTEVSRIKEMISKGKLSREDLGLKEGDLVLISVNRLSPEKGISYLIDALNLIKREIGNIKLILIGSGPDEKNILSQIKVYKLTDNVVHLKNVKEEELYNCYAISDIYVSPTLHTDFVMSILEAMVCGLPIVSTGQEFLVKDGVNGYVVPKRKPKAIADAVLKMYENNSIKKMGFMSKNIVKNYDWNIIAKKAIEEYEKLIIT